MINEIYRIVRRGTTGEQSIVMRRYNIASETKINYYEYNKENMCVYIIDSDYI